MSSASRILLTFPASTVEILVKTFIIAVGATGLKLVAKKTQNNKGLSQTLSVKH